MESQANLVSLFYIKKYFRIKKRRHDDAVDNQILILRWENMLGFLIQT